MYSFLDWLFTQLILGDFKWTLLGAALLASALLLYLAVYFICHGRWRTVRVILGAAFIVLFLYFGHELVDPLFHRLEEWYVTPMGEPMHLTGGYLWRICIWCR